MRGIKRLGRHVRAILLSVLMALAADIAAFTLEWRFYRRPTRARGRPTRRRDSRLYTVRDLFWRWYVRAYTGHPVPQGAAPPTNFPSGLLSRGVPLPSGDIPVTGGDVFHVSSTHTNANDGNSGKNPDHPLATIDAAIGKCTASKGDIILVYPGHVEDLGNGETIDADIAGISIIGLGNGPDRPRIDYNHATASFDIGANGVLVRNLTFRPSVATVTIGIDIEANVTDTRLEDIEALPGEEGDGTDEFVLFVDIKAGCDRTWINGLRYAHHASADGAASAVKLTGASDRVRISNFWIEITGAAAVAGINGITTLSTRLLIENGVITTDTEPGIELLTGTTGVIRDVDIFADLATIDAATVADGMAHFRVAYVEVGNEADTQVKTESIDD